ncbi:Phosphopantetheine adenylyltransferase [Corynebacterium kutscheri]|uniref:Phosphopantetheine adenylyltransferase n=1 Tax=Corynebacterium kutscheri TaxID=35755 RepID=A0A0F6QZC9_9CORY|nr:pantetheine-phosphate adenylyltransferase [Corynebacterium kutscheri]AKE41077.1 Phosphopantetheine adenylyltransferase [Corynebacterium kutscheri]VEH06967.1 Phosphopantetheine adenylyltransferase [Corynebacterium kutscheri]VEH09381.1 Phosphopantetheine adenylyltransferase [Corynebacterium kutscheri]VEH79462.1 Phosphopantetheine adenylyltransferase [Corynebacterium kutscheri]
MTTAVCPGSFDPVTRGHIDIIMRAHELFDEVVVLVTANPNKPSGMFNVEERKELIRQALIDEGINTSVIVDHWSGLLVDYTSARDISVLIKGLRSSLDYEYELPMAQMNRKLSGIETAFLMTDPKYGYISSTLCKEVMRYGGDVSEMLPKNVYQAMQEKLRVSR